MTTPTKEQHETELQKSYNLNEYSTKILVDALKQCSDQTQKEITDRLEQVLNGTSHQELQETRDRTWMEKNLGWYLFDQKSSQSEIKELADHNGVDRHFICHAIIDIGLHMVRNTDNAISLWDGLERDSFDESKIYQEANHLAHQVKRAGDMEELLGYGSSDEELKKHAVSLGKKFADAEKKAGVT